jgi:4-hydroxy-3-methylbut-2-enyl diphosphate reductase
VEADLAIVVGGYNSSNTSHLVELLETKFKTFYIKDEDEFISSSEINHFDLHKNEVIKSTDYLPTKRPLQIILTSGASCPDATVDRVIQRIGELANCDLDIETALTKIKLQFNESV